MVPSVRLGRGRRGAAPRATRHHGIGQQVFDGEHIKLSRAAERHGKRQRARKPHAAVQPIRNPARAQYTEQLRAEVTFGGRDHQGTRVDERGGKRTAALLAPLARGVPATSTATATRRKSSATSLGLVTHRAATSDWSNRPRPRNSTCCVSTEGNVA